MNNGVTYINLEYFFNKILQIFNYIFNGGPQPASAPNFFQFVLFGLTVVFIIVIIYCAIRMQEIRRKEKIHLRHEIAEYAHHQAMREREAMEKKNTFKNEKWGMVLEHAFAESEGDWKMAIIEADTMLEGLMDQLGFRGENLGERLKAAKDSNFKFLTSAWEVHTVRNRIAHEGSDFTLPHHEAKRLVALYEEIFREYDYI